MNIHKIAEKSRVPLKHLRRLEKLGVLKVDKNTDEMPDKIRLAIQRGNALSAEQCLYLLKRDDWQDEFPEFVERAENQIDCLGDPSKSAAPWGAVAMYVADVSAKNTKATETVALWLVHCINTMQSAQCDHTYLAVRLLWNVPEIVVPMMAKALHHCMWNCRKSEILSGYWRSEGGKTVYHKAMLDL